MEMGDSIGSETMLIGDYLRAVDPTDTMPNEILPVLFGLFGEVGGVMSAAKKAHREGDVFRGLRDALEEEFGDTLWYLAALCRRLNCSLEGILSEVLASEDFSSVIAASDLPDGPLAEIRYPNEVVNLDMALSGLGQRAAALFELDWNSDDFRPSLVEFTSEYVKALQVSGVTFGRIAKANAKKTRGRFLEPNLADLPTFDSGFPEEEQLPATFKVEISQRSSGKSYLRWNGVFIGDPLTDNIKDKDGYRFHDVFHLAHAAVLHWSPVMRALIKHKRKSSAPTDEAQDGGRAIVVEEGLTAWIFSKAKGQEFFAGQEKLSFDMLKTVQAFVKGYEVEEVPLRLWESAILQGYEVFRKCRENNGGTIIGDRKNRTIRYEKVG